MIKRIFLLFSLHMALIACFMYPVRAERVPAVVYKDQAYLFGKPELVMAADVGEAQASPNGRYLLAIGNSPAKELFAAIITEPSTATPVVTLYLYDANRRRTVALWKATDDANEDPYNNQIRWLADGETALVTIRHSKRIEDASGADGSVQPQYAYTTELLLVNAARSTARVLPIAGISAASFDGKIEPSPTRNEAILAYRTEDGKPYEIRLVAATGLMSAPITLSATHLVESNWNDDGTLWGQLGSQPHKDKTDKTPYPYGYIIFNRATKTITEQKEQPKWLKEFPTIPEPESFLISEAQSATVSADNAQQVTWTLVVRTEDNKDKTIIALDATDVCVLNGKKIPVVIYKSKNALYSVTAHPIPYADYIAFARREIEANARQISSSIEQWMYDNKAESFPTNADPIALLVGNKAYMKRDIGFRDPHTGELAFKNVYTGKADANGKIPLYALKTSVGTITIFHAGAKPEWTP